MMFTLLHGEHPFYKKGMTNDEYIAKLNQSKIDIPPAFPEYVYDQNGQKPFFKAMLISVN
jgi:hypothetical protein